MTSASTATRPDMYISADIECDGPIPGMYSMLSFGLAVAGTYDGCTYAAAPPHANTLYVELKPISDRYDPEMLRHCQLDRNRLELHGTDPRVAMQEAGRWVEETTAGYRPVIVAYPASFDWMFLNYYFVAYGDAGCPFLHSSVICIKSMYFAKANTTVSRSVKPLMPETLKAQPLHTHNALDDAIEQAELFSNIMRWKPHARSCQASQPSSR